MQRHKTCIPRHDERGFTLIELVVAVAILATVAVVVVSSFTGTLNSIEQAQEIAEYSQIARLVVERMLSDLNSTLFVSEDESYQFLGLNGDAEEERGPTVSFATLAPGMPMGGAIRGGVTRVEYFLGPHPEDEEETALYRRESSLLAGASEESGKIALLGEHIREFHLDYYDTDGTLHATWDSAVAEGERSLPVAVRIRIVIGGTDHGRFFSTVVPIP